MARFLRCDDQSDQGSNPNALTTLALTDGLLVLPLSVAVTVAGLTEELAAIPLTDDPAHPNKKTRILWLGYPILDSD